MVPPKVIRPVFREGDPVVVAEGPNPGTPGVFLRLRPDVNWAEITYRDGSVHRHAVVWLAHSTNANPQSGNDA